MNFLKLFICLIMLCVSLSGCTQLLWEGMPITNRERREHIQMQDQVIAALQYQNFSASIIRNGKKIQLDLPSEGIAFLGEKNVYILTKGTSDLMLLDKISGEIPLLAGKNQFGYYDTLRIRVMPPKRNNPIMQFDDQLKFRVRDSYNLTTKQIALLKQAKITQDTDYTKYVDITGIVIPRANLAYTFNDKDIQLLDKKHTIEFYSVSTWTNVHPVNLAFVAIFTPLTLTADLIFYPFWHD